jgi:alpha-1,2-mannosyltransferase
MSVPLSAPRPRETKLLIAALVLYAVVAIPVSIRRGTDLAIHLTVAQSWLDGTPLYSSNPRVGAWWPPFAILLVAPFAIVAHVSAALSKAAWAVMSLVCLGWSIQRLSNNGWRAVLIAVSAVAVPLHRNFEDLNLNAMLLALLVAAAYDLDGEREGRAGLWIGAATALKVFPGLLLVYMAIRGRWRAVLVGTAAAVCLTLGPLLRYGGAAAVGGVRAWLTNSAPVGWTLRGSNQSLSALATRLHLATPGLVALYLFCVVLAFAALRRPRVAHPAFEEVAVVALVAVLWSPIAWVHYFLLALPAWIVALRLPAGGRARAWSIYLTAAGVATSGLLTVWSLSLRSDLFELSIYTWGALMLLAVLAFAPRGTREAVSTPGTG